MGRTVAYAENFRGGAKFRQNRVTSQINFKEKWERRHVPGKIVQNYT